MKKTIRPLALVLVLCIFAAMALGSGSKSGDVKEPASVSGANTPQQTEENKMPETSEAKLDENTETKSGTTIDEVVLLDEANVKITAKSFEEKTLFGSAVKLLIENNSGKSLTVQSRNASVNGYMVQTMMSADVADGKKANDELVFLKEDLESAGITTVAEMEFSFHIFESDTWEGYFDSEMISLKTSAAEGYTYSFDNSGHEAYNNNGVEIVVKGLANDPILGPEIVVYISNQTKENICVQLRDVSINGFMVDPIFSAEVVVGKHAVDEITFMSSELEENGIAAIDEVELSFHIFNSENWNTIEDTDPVVIKFEN